MLFTYFPGAVCFFCPANYTDLKDLLNHMQVIHEFDYEEMKHELQLSFYQQIKLINFIRRQMHLNQCINCSEKFCDSESLMAHMKTESHLKPPNEKEDWDQSQYYFPTYENDNFLCLIGKKQVTAFYTRRSDRCDGRSFLYNIFYTRRSDHCGQQRSLRLV